MLEFVVKELFYLDEEIEEDFKDSFNGKKKCCNKG